jgi:hypothetical protein
MNKQQDMDNQAAAIWNMTDPEPAGEPEEIQDAPQYAPGTRRYLLENMPATPRGMTPCAHVNLKVSKELLAYLDEERFRFGMNRTELINKILLAYAKENPHR